MSGSESSSPAVGAAEPLTLTVHALPDPAASDESRRTTAGRWKMLGVLLVCAAPVIASYVTYFVIRPEGRTNYAELVEPPRAWPAAMGLQTLDGTPVAPASLQGQWLLVAVGPAACDAACERRLYMQRQLREMMGRERDRLDKVWLVTDEAALRPEVAAAMQAAPPVTVLRAPRAQVDGWLQAAPGAAVDDHLYIVDPMGQWMMRAPVEADPAKLKRDLDRLLRASSFWDQPGR